MIRLLRIAARVAASGKHKWEYKGQEVTKTLEEKDPPGTPHKVGIWHLWKCPLCGEEIYTDKASVVPDPSGCSKSRAN